MPIHDIYSRRQKRLRDEFPDVYVYNHFPTELRNQFIHIFNDAFDSSIDSSLVDELYRAMENALAREYGKAYLGAGGQSAKNAVLRHIEKEQNIEWVLDAVELAMQTIEWRKFAQIFKPNPRGLSHRSSSRRSSEELVEELNTRFKENGVGYEYTNGQIIRIDNQHIHNEAIQPALELLHDSMYEGANHEFREAFDHYRKNEYKPAMVAAVKAFESTMKAICDKRGWNYNPTRDASSELIKIILDNGLIPNYLTNHFNSLKALLESIATPRNKIAGHGQGAQIKEAPEYMVRFTLNMVASAIVMLAEAEKAKYT